MSKADREEYTAKRIEELQRQLDQAIDGVKEMGILTDALLVQMALQYGSDIQGGRELRLPTFDAADLVGRHGVSVEKDDFEYVVRIHPKGE